jgi:hypothetical protein
MTCVILTASIDVSPDMPFVGLRNTQERLKDCQVALKWWMENTPYNIVVVENTGYDLKVKDERIELITLNANFKNIVEKGKGFAEGVSINEAYKQSAFLNQSNIHIKCSGRYYVSNIVSVVDGFDGLVAIEEEDNPYFINSVCFVYRPPFYHTYLCELLPTIDDDAGRWMEHILANAVRIADTQGEQIIRTHYQTIGRSGTHTQIPK